MAKPRCTVTFTRGRYGMVANLMYKGERLNSESFDPHERKLVEYTLMKQCKERVAARIKDFDRWDPGLFFRTLDVMRARRR